jgi:hypothetical protein
VPQIAGFNASLRTYCEAAQSALPRGHGVAAEHASNLLDRLLGRVVVHLGSDNARAGPDRSVNGVLIQTKYCSTGSKCIADCFDAAGFRYRLADGTPMQVEVPKDLYDAALDAMKHRIRKGQVPGIEDPENASKIVRPGRLTYRQARRLGKAGSFEALALDTATGVRSSALPVGLSATAQFIAAAGRGQRVTVCFAEAGKAGGEAGVTALFTHVLTRQLARTSLEAGLAPATNWAVGNSGGLVARAVATAAGRTGLSGAAASSYAAKALRGNIVSAVAATAVLASVEVVRVGRGKATGREAAQNVATSAAGVAGGTAGWVAVAGTFAALGSVVPVVGTGVGLFIGGMIGSMGGGAAATKGAKGLVRKLTRKPGGNICEDRDLEDRDNAGVTAG